jgi:hypothetical protein
MGAGKRSRVVSVEEHQTTHREHEPHPAELPVLVCEKATYKDQPISPIEIMLSTESNIVSAMEECNVFDLYSTEDMKSNEPNNQSCRPFLQYVSFAGPKGKIVRVKVLFDEGAMTNVMCSSVFNRIKHRLGNWGPSKKKL